MTAKPLKPLTASPIAAPTGVAEYLLAFADDEHLMGQQHTEWIGVAPFLEEDLAFSSIGQDELGHAALLYELTLTQAGIEPTEAAVDALAYRRDGEDYRSSTMAEFATGDWGQALIRHWLYDLVEELRWELVANSSVSRLAEIAAVASREETFHRRHAEALLDRLLLAPAARTRLDEALQTVEVHLPSLLEPVAGEAEALATGVASAPLASLEDRVSAAIASRFDRPAQATPSTRSTGGRLTRSADFAPLMTRMREVLDFDPDASW